MSFEVEWILETQSATENLGSWIGRACQGGEVILLEGALGAGKTSLTRAIAQGLGVTQSVTSPTFVILRSYPARDGLTLNHFDFYRLKGDFDLESIGYEECVHSKSVVIVEWPGQCPGVLCEYDLKLALTYDINLSGSDASEIPEGADERRKVYLTTHSKKWQSLMTEISVF